MQRKYVLSKILTVALQNYGKNQLENTLLKPFLINFSRIFSQHFSNRPYLNVKIILAFSTSLKLFKTHCHFMF